MNKMDFVLGIIIGLATTFLGCYLFINFYTTMTFVAGAEALQRQGLIGKVITLGSLLNLISFTILFKYKKDSIAKGIIAAVLLMTVLTLFL